MSFSRTQLLLGNEAMSRLQASHVLVVGLGGVGGYAAEMLCRAGVGEMTIVDGDTVGESNINRQIIALHSTLGQPKAELFRQRLLDINPSLKLHAVQEFLRDDRLVQLLEDFKDCQAGHRVVVDCIDTLSPKVFLLYHSVRLGLPVVSSMGSGGKTDPSQVQVVDISRSHSCPLAAMVRKRLRRLGLDDLLSPQAQEGQSPRTPGIRVVFSPEKVPAEAMLDDPSQNHRTTIGTISYIPPLFGCHIAAEVVKLLIEK